MSAQTIDNVENKKISLESLMSNSGKIGKYRTVLSIVAGILCGIFGLTSLSGLLFFLAASLLADFSILLKINFKSHEYLNVSMIQFLIDGITFTAMTYILFWTLSFALVYIY